MRSTIKLKHLVGGIYKNSNIFKVRYVHITIQMKSQERVVQLLESNDWGNEAQEHIMLSPRTRFALDTLVRHILKLPVVAYRWTSGNSEFDGVIHKPGMGEAAYTMNYPMSATLDKVGGTLVGIPLILISAGAGLGYRLVDNSINLYERLVPAYK